MAKSLLLSVHDVTPGHAEPIAALEALLRDAVGADAAWAMLVVPDFHRRWPVAGDRAFQRWLRARAEAGCEMFLHGMFHVEQFNQGSKSDWRGRHLTAGEGEFLSLTRAEAAQRIADGRAVIEDAIGRAVDGFVAPAWLYGPGAKAAVAEAGFALAEDHLRVWSPLDGRTLARGPVVTWASRSRARMRSSLWFAGLARVALRPLQTVRVAVHPGDAGHGVLMADIARTLRAFAAGRRLGRYRELLGCVRQPSILRTT